jgi:ribosomal protein S18 acetylase RimI-like enzyme
MTIKKEIVVRQAGLADRDAILAVERKSTPGLQYLPQVFEQFLADQRGEFSVAEIDGEIVACAKFTVLPDNSAWLETIRVDPKYQGLGIGKRFYENYFRIAEREGAHALRMYTGVNNVVSKGLAERYGLQLSQTFFEATYSLDGDAVRDELLSFEQVTDTAVSTNLIMPHQAKWQDYLAMNRTFYKITPALCAYLAERGEVYADAESGSVVVAGARFMPEQALHLGFFSGDLAKCVQFALQLGAKRGVPSVKCLFPIEAQMTADVLEGAGCKRPFSELIVMEIER